MAGIAPRLTRFLFDLTGVLRYPEEWRTWERELSQRSLSQSKGVTLVRSWRGVHGEPLQGALGLALPVEGGCL